MKDPLVVKTFIVIKIGVKTIHQYGEEVLFKFFISVITTNTVLSKFNCFIKTLINNTISSFYPRQGITNDPIILFFCDNILHTDKYPTLQFNSFFHNLVGIKVSPPIIFTRKIVRVEVIPNG